MVKGWPERLKNYSSAAKSSSVSFSILVLLRVIHNIIAIYFELLLFYLCYSITSVYLAGIYVHNTLIYSGTSHTTMVTN